MRKIKRTTTTLFAVLVAGGLSFGVTSALAGPTGLGNCPVQPPQFLGRCFSLADCKAACELHGAVDGGCPSGCCVCYFTAP